MKGSSLGAKNHTETWPPTVSKVHVEGDAASLDEDLPQNHIKPGGSLSIVDSGPFACTENSKRTCSQFHCHNFCYDTEVTVKVSLRKI